MLLQSQVALVTGASRGIGQAIALELGKQGAIVIGTATTAEGAVKISELLSTANVQGKGMVLDVKDDKGIETVLTEIKAQFGSVNILVNNAGITRDNLLLRMKDEEWDVVLATNLTAIFKLTKACVKDMIKARQGRIINIGSVVGTTGNGGQANYCAAKAGLVGFSKALASEIASRNVTVNVVAPGFIETDMTQVLPEEQKEKLLAQIPANRLGQPVEIAQACVFLASPHASYITGQTLHVNGGMYMN